MVRSGRATYLVRFDAKHERNTKNCVMKHLGKEILGSLRMGDLFTRASPNQYILMLHNLTYEDCKALVERITHALDAKYLSKIIGTSIRKIVPIEEYGERKKEK